MGMRVILLKNDGTFMQVRSRLCGHNKTKNYRINQDCRLVERNKEFSAAG
jgi:hypothetical protein